MSKERGARVKVISKPLGVEDDKIVGCEGKIYYPEDAGGFLVGKIFVRRW